MAEYIDIDAPIDVAVYQRNRRIQVTLRQILESNDAKYEAADMRPVVRGKWEHLTMDKHSQTCSACRTIYYNILDYPFNFCPNCGADMREEK